jgi:molybdopterin/thiamine biosynthesis adenylyltransferase
MRYSFTLLEGHRDRLRDLLHRDERERVAVVLCGRSRCRDPWTEQFEERFIAREVIEIGDDWIIDHDKRHVMVSTDPIYQAAKRASLEDCAVAFIHSHPQGVDGFSDKDDRNEPELFEMIFNRTDTDRPHLSLILMPDGQVRGRAWDAHLHSHSLCLVRVLGSRFSFWYPSRGEHLTRHAFDRQVRAFGPAFTEDLRALRVGIAGCGGTGSAVAMVLARCGVGHLALFDADIVDPTNLNRLHGARQADADAGTLKVDVLGRSITELGLGCQVRRFPIWIGDQRARHALKSCDIVFGCTDDHAGRSILNRLAYFYCVPVFDLGVLLDRADQGSPELFRTMDGRVTALFPGHPCLACRDFLDPDRIRAESLKRDRPEQYERERALGYLPREGEPNPVVVTFTTETATMAINEMFQRMIGFRGPDGSWSERVRQFHVPKDHDIHSGGRPRPGCKLCDTGRYVGRGDMEHFLDQA